VGRPQFYALLLLLLFLAQGSWLARRPPIAGEAALVDAGRNHLYGYSSAASAEYSPLVALAGSGILIPPGIPPKDLPRLRFLLRLPFILAGVFFGFSLWHVARRLYGNNGGYIALALYAFSPLMIVASATVGHDLIAAWGAFGAVFTAIALSHTLLAPPADRVRRTILLGVALGMGIGADYSVAVVIPAALALMLYLAPERRTAAVAWLAAATAVAGMILWAVFFFNAEAMLGALRQARFFALRPQEVAGGIPYDALVTWLVGTIPALAMFGVALMAFLRSRRSRYFGNALPLALGGALFLVSLATPYYLSVKYLIWALPFLYLFGAGVFADLLEEPPSSLWARRLVIGALVANAVGCVALA
jgi:4-amino-4-deoxy-L-arabinose transferase-like glycosyltransferase